MSSAPAQPAPNPEAKKSQTKRRLLMGLGSIFILLIFLSSYYTLRNLSTGSTSTSSTTNTAPPPPTTYGLATANALILSYNNTFSILAACHNSNSTTVINNVTAIISNLEGNNSVYNSYTIGNQTLVDSGTSNTSSIYRIFEKQLNATAFSCLTFSTDAQITLPPILNVYIVNKTYELSVPTNLRRSLADVIIAPNITTPIPVKVAVLVTDNGTIYSLNVTRIK